MNSFVARMTSGDVMPHVWSSPLKSFLGGVEPSSTVASILPKAEAEPSHLHIPGDLREAAQQAAAASMLATQLGFDLKDTELLAALNGIIMAEHLATWRLRFMPQRCAPQYEDRQYCLGLGYDRQAVDANVPFVAPGVRYARMLGSPVNRALAEALRAGIAFQCEGCREGCLFLRHELRN